jgi:hypothetical protein
MYLLRHRPVSSTPSLKRWGRHADATFQRRNQVPCLTLHIQLVRRSEARLIIHTPAKPDGLLHTVFTYVSLVSFGS